MVMIGRFSSDDPGWREPWEREPERNNDDSDWTGLDPRPKRVAARRTSRHKGNPKSSERADRDPTTDAPTSDI